MEEFIKGGAPPRRLGTIRKITTFFKAIRKGIEIKDEILERAC